jgi:hypothetical protein
MSIPLWRWTILLGKKFWDVFINFYVLGNDLGLDDGLFWGGLLGDICSEVIPLPPFSILAIFRGVNESFLIVCPKSF